MDGKPSGSQGACLDESGHQTPYQGREDAAKNAFLSPALAVLSEQSQRRSSRPDIGSRRSSTTSLMKLSSMLPDEDEPTLETYGINEVRDGFFDVAFLKPRSLPAQHELQGLKQTLPAEFDERPPLAIKHFVPRQWREFKSVVRTVLTTRTGIKLSKTFIAFFIAYVLCLVPDVRDWLGQHHYIMAVSVILNHPARTFGSQVDGTILTSIGTALGVAWGVVGLLLSTSTLAASAGYGGILALFLLLFIAGIAWIRAFFVRFYQAVLSAGITIIYTTLAETDSKSIRWPKLLSYPIPWLLGQAIALSVNVLVFPDAGARPLAVLLHQSIMTMQDALVMPQARDTRLRRRLAQTFVNLSEGYRDMVIDMTISRFRPDDVKLLRNSMQAVIRALLSMDTETAVFTDETHLDSPIQNPKLSDESETASKLIAGIAQPTMELIACMRDALERCDAVLMDTSGHRSHIGPAPDVSSDVTSMQIRIKHVMASFDLSESALLQSGNLSDSSKHDPDLVQHIVYARHVRETAGAVQELLSHVRAVQTVSSWPHLYLPSYPFFKAIYRTNAQIRHDRGGVVAGSYQITFGAIARLLDKIKSRAYKPTPHMNIRRHEEDLGLKPAKSNATGNRSESDAKPKKTTVIRYQMWRVLHRLQGFESKYALKACLVTSLLSVPSYLEQSKWWWDRYEGWWAVAMCWVVMHPRVGGNLQDLVNRALLAIFGAVWAGAAYAAGNGNPYVMAVFSAIYMIPMLCRYAHSTHPRSGLVGCLSFTVISLSLHGNGGDASPTLIAVHKGLVFFVGTAAPILVNWVLWPFVARHELRFALSSMLFFMSVAYRSVVAKYVYFEKGNEPTEDDIQSSEMLEGRLREGFVRIRQLLVLTRHELRLRAKFDAVPYSALADATEHFFEHLIAVRQSATFYNTGFIRDSPIAAEKLLGYRRDAVAAVLANLYILAGALRSQRKVPRYLPSAASARKTLLTESDKVEEQLMAEFTGEGEKKAHKQWSDIYRFSYNQSLTGCIVQLEEMERFTKLIVGEQGFDDVYGMGDKST